MNKSPNDVKQKVLIVDDDPRNQRIVIETLEDFADYKIASTGEEALSAIDSYTPDLVLLDIMMPGMDGYEVCKKIRANPLHIWTKVIMLSGKAMLEEKLKGYEVGADSYLSKPFAPRELFAQMKVFLRLTAVEKSLEFLSSALERNVLEKADQLLSNEITGNVSHQIHDYLASINTNLSYLQEMVDKENLDTKKLQECTSNINKMVEKISHGVGLLSKNSKLTPKEMDTDFSL